MPYPDRTDPNCGVALEPTEDVRSSPATEATFGEVAAAHMGRRGFLKGAMGTTAYAALAIAPASLLAACGADGEPEPVEGGVSVSGEVRIGVTGSL